MALPVEKRHNCIEEEMDGDPDQLLQCPYDKNHMVRAMRFPYHLIKCKKNHPKLASELRTCPFNARHLVPKNELSHHTATCVYRQTVNMDQDRGSSEGHSNWHVPVSTWTGPIANEDWDKESDSAVTPFVWGTTKIGVNIKTATSPSTNNLTPTLRAPKTLPWPTFSPEF